MAFATGNFTTKPAFRLESSINVIGWTTDPQNYPGQSIALVEVVVGIRRTTGADTTSGTGSLSIGFGGGGEVVPFSYNFASTDYVQIYRVTWERLVQYSDDWAASVTTSTTLGTASANVGAMTYPPPTTATQPSFAPVVFNAGTSITISLPKQVSTYTHDIYYTFGALKNISLAAGISAATYATTPPLSLLQQIPNTPEAPYTITVVTKTSTGSVVGTLSFTGTLRAPSSQAPTVSAFSVSDTNATATAQVGKFIQGVSVLKLDSITATAAQGATISERRLGIEGQEVQINGTRALLNSGTIPVTARAWDSRGLIGALAGNVDVLPYAAPDLGRPAAGLAYRSNASGVAQSNGQNLAITLVGSVASLVNGTERNSLTVRISTRTIDSDVWTVRNTVTPTTSTSAGRIMAYPQTIVVGGGAIYLTDTSYVVRIELYDKFNTALTDEVVPTSFVTVDLNGAGVGVGRLHSKGALDVAAPGGFFQGVYTTFQNYASANDATFGGWFSITTGMTGLPAGFTPGNHKLQVDRATVSGGVDAITQYIRHPLDPERVLYYRLGVAALDSLSVAWDPWVASQQSGLRYGTDAERLALDGGLLFDGMKYRATDTNLEWVRAGGSWLLVPGQTLATLEYSGASVTGAVGTRVDGVASTPTLPIGQRVRVSATYSQYATAAATASLIYLHSRNNATDVTYADYTKRTGTRGYSASGGGVHSSSAPFHYLTTTVAAKVSAAVFLGSATSGIYAADVMTVSIQSA